MLPIKKGEAIAAGPSIATGFWDFGLLALLLCGQDGLATLL